MNPYDLLYQVCDYYGPEVYPEIKFGIFYYEFEIKNSKIIVSKLPFVGKAIKVRLESKNNMTIGASSEMGFNFYDDGRAWKEYRNGCLDSEKIMNDISFINKNS